MHGSALAFILSTVVMGAAVAPPEGDGAFATRVSKLQAEVRGARMSRQYNTAARGYLDLHKLALDVQGPGDNALASLDGAVRMLAADSEPKRETFCAAAEAISNYQRRSTSSASSEVVAQIRREFERIATERGLTCDPPPEVDPPTLVATPNDAPKADESSEPPVAPDSVAPAQPVRPDDRQRKTHLGAYVTLGLGGGVGVVLLASGLAWGARTERTGRQQALAGADADGLQASSIADGRAANALAIAGGTIAAAAVIAGSVVLGVVRRPRTSRGERRVTIGAGTLRVKF